MYERDTDALPVWFSSVWLPGSPSLLAFRRERAWPDSVSGVRREAGRVWRRAFTNVGTKRRRKKNGGEFQISPFYSCTKASNSENAEKDKWVTYAAALVHQHNTLQIMNKWFRHVAAGPWNRTWELKVAFSKIVFKLFGACINPAERWLQHFSIAYEKKQIQMLECFIKWQRSGS